MPKFECARESLTVFLRAIGLCIQHFWSVYVARNRAMTMGGFGPIIREKGFFKALVGNGGSFPAAFFKKFLPLDMLLFIF